MPLDFHSNANRFTYASRRADPAWMSAIQKIVTVEGKQVLDIGCGGGIYCRAFADMGAARVTGIDFSAEMIKTAVESCKDYRQVSFEVGNALHTNLSSQYDVILERALIHHLTDLESCFREALRLLRPGGVLIVQSRTVEDALQPPNEKHIRGYFFELYPRLINVEVKRRHASTTVSEALRAAGFATIEERELYETRRVYGSFDELKQDLLARTGRSILHELSDSELGSLVDYIVKHLQDRSDQEIVEQDYWTIWAARKA